MTDPHVCSKSHSVFYLCVDSRHMSSVHTVCVYSVPPCIPWFPYFLLLLFSFVSHLLSPCLSPLSASLTPLSMTLLPHRHQAKVRELEEKCRTQSEQFNLLSKELEKFRLQAGKFDILSTEPLTLCESPGSPNKSLSQLLNGLAAPIGKGTCRIILMNSVL